MGWNVCLGGAYLTVFCPCILLLVTLYSEHWTLKTVHYTVYMVNCTLYIINCTLYTLNFTIYTVHCILYSLYWILHIVQCTVYIVHCRVYSVQCLRKCILSMYLTVSYRSGTAGSAQKHIYVGWHCAECRFKFAMCILHCVVCIVQSQVQWWTAILFL